MPAPPLYVDPGTGALVWQTLVAAGVGLLFYLRRFRTWLFQRLGLRRDAPPGGDATPERAER